MFFRCSETGRFEVDIDLQLGETYEYKFVVDDQWMHDPEQVYTNTVMQIHNNNSSYSLYSVCLAYTK